MERRTKLIQTVAGAIIGIIAAVYAYTTGELVGWGVAVVSAGVVDPETVLSLLRGKTPPPDPPEGGSFRGRS